MRKRNFAAAVLILVGLCLFLYPSGEKLYRQWRNRQTMAVVERLRVQETTDLAQTEPAETSIEETTEPLSEMDLLRQELEAYNRRIYEEGQANLCDPFSYETPPIDLTAYGFEENVIATIWIPRMDVELPVYLGASIDNMALGPAILGETSLPLRGENTNVVIAGHRGYRGAPMFRDIQLLQIGDKIMLTTPWETLIYRVCELEIISPADSNAILIQPGRQLLTLFTCHPYTKNYQRYLVRAELTEEKPASTRKEDLVEAKTSFDLKPRQVKMTQEDGSTVQIPVEPVSIQPEANEGAEWGASYSNLQIWLEKYAPWAVAAMVALEILIKLLRKRRGVNHDGK